jgi:putative ABC transport system substrate-binding protein
VIGRTIIAGIVAAALMSPVACAEDKTPVIGVLFGSSRELLLMQMPSFAAGLRQEGIEPGRDARIEERASEGRSERLPELLSGLVRLPASVLFVSGGIPVIEAVKAAHSPISTVFAFAVDPVKYGLVQSFNRPGSNMTGVYMPFTAGEAKRLQLLHQMLPAARNIGVLLDRGPNAAITLDAIREPASGMGLTLDAVTANDENELIGAFDQLARDGVDAVLNSSTPSFVAWRERIAALAEAHRLPVMGILRMEAQAGEFASYGADSDETFHEAGRQVARVLKGERPDNLPVVQTTRFRLVINLRTTKALGLTIPTTLLATADEVIE